ncbi:hypothetical protein ACQY0O_000680 [Thecaphora frezii]
MAYQQPHYPPNGAHYGSQPPPPASGYAQHPAQYPQQQYPQQQYPQQQYPQQQYPQQQQQQFAQPPAYNQGGAPYQQQSQPQQPPRPGQPRYDSTMSGNGQAPVPAHGEEKRPDALPEQAQQALAAFGSPYAHSKDWAPAPEDSTLLSLPQQAFKMRVKQRFARTAGDIFNPPAPSFSRPPSQQFSYTPFVPISIKASGKLLADGFKPLYPGRVLVDHDVSAADWARFLEDIGVAGRLTGGQSVIAQVAPVTMHLGTAGYFLTKALEKNMKRKKIPLIAEAVETWQQRFFLPRRLDVYVVEANERLTARQPGEAVPGTPLPAKTQKAEGDSSDSSDSDSSDSDSSDSEDEHSGKPAGPHEEGLTSKQLRRQRKKERKAARREAKKERKEKRREKKTKRKEAKRSVATLVIAPAA